MRLTEFISAHGDWEELLSAPPYCIKIKRDGGYIIFSYSQIESDFGIELVRECRGVILEDITFRPVCVPFYKFGNYGESYVPQIDWASARTQEKIDGSLIKVWFDKGEWRVSTSGNIFAANSVLERTDLFPDGCPYNTYGDLFEAAKTAAGLDFDRLNRQYTYMFELVSPYNKVVIMYDKAEIYHIGTRDNVTLQEIEIDIGVKKPREFALGSLDDCVTAAQNLPDDKEGYVVVDRYYNRVKIKNPVYVALHHIKNNGAPSLVSLIGIIRKNEAGEYLTYFPEFKSKIDECKRKIDGILAEMESGKESLRGKTFETQRDFALEVKGKRFNNFYFEWRKDNALTPSKWLWRQPDEKIRTMLLSID